MNDEWNKYGRFIQGYLAGLDGCAPGDTELMTMYIWGMYEGYAEYKRIQTIHLLEGTIGYEDDINAVIDHTIDIQRGK